MVKKICGSFKRKRTEAGMFHQCWQKPGHKKDHVCGSKWCGLKWKVRKK